MRFAAGYHGLRRFGTLAVVHHHHGALARKGLGDGRTQPSAGAGHQHGLLLKEAAHGLPGSRSLATKSATERSREIRPMAR